MCKHEQTRLGHHLQAVFSQKPRADVLGRLCTLSLHLMHHIGGGLPARLHEGVQQQRGLCIFRTSEIQIILIDYRMLVIIFRMIIEYPNIRNLCSSHDYRIIGLYCPHKDKDWCGWIGGRAYGESMELVRWLVNQPTTRGSGPSKQKIFLLGRKIGIRDLPK